MPDVAETTDGIDESFVPVPRSSVVSVELDGERVLFDAVGARVHRLDPIGSLVWACFDGRSSVAEVAQDVAQSFGADRAQVQRDILDLVKALAALGAVGHDAGPDMTSDNHRAEMLPAAVPTQLNDPPGG